MEPGDRLDILRKGTPMMGPAELARLCRDTAWTVVRGLGTQGDLRAARDALAYELSATIDEFVRLGKMRPDNPLNRPERG
jgi:hypothetical protein